MQWGIKMKKFSLIIIFLLLCHPVFADVFDYPSSLENIFNQTPKITSIKCKFKQEKYIPNITKPIVSEGDFKFIENEGVTFYTTYPVKSVTDYSNKNYKQINNVINAISSKKYSKLEKEFSFFYTNKSNNWIIGLKPKKNSNAFDYISSITIYGTDYINRVDIKQINGNKTKIWFEKSF